MRGPEWCGVPGNLGTVGEGTWENQKPTRPSAGLTPGAEKQRPARPPGTQTGTMRNPRGTRSGHRGRGSGLVVLVSQKSPTAASSPRRH